MGEFDPVPWDEMVAATGAPAAEVEEYVAEIGTEVRDEDPYTAVKAVHDALSEDFGEDLSVPGLGEVFVTAYLLEKRGAIAPDGEYPSVLDRRPTTDRLRDLFWERERTIWWIAILTGVHPTLVTYWLYEDDVPLMERNLGPESMARVRAYRESESE